MDKKEFLKNELCRYWGGGSLLALCLTVFSFVGWVQGIPLAVLCYVALLCICLALLLLGWNMACAWRRVKRLNRLAQNLPASLRELPTPTGAEQAVLMQLLEQLAGQYNQKQSEASTARRRMTDYYTLWAHQIKTPIAAMQLLLQTSEPDPQMQSELFKIEQYVELVLQYLRSEDMASDLAVSRTPLEPLVKGVVRKYARLFIIKKIELVLQPLPGSALTDEKWLAFCLEQLFSNALKYTPEGGRITVGLAPGPAPVLFVADTGCGIASEDLPRVMERGFTGYNGRENKKSTGIGLYLCRRVLHTLGHRFWLESAPGRGTTAFIDLAEKELGVE